MEKITYKAHNRNDGRTCGHDHKTREAAEKCLPAIRKRPHAAGSVIIVDRYHNGIQG